MAVGKLVTKAAAPVVEEVVSQFTKRLFRGAKIPTKTQKIVGKLNEIDQKTILSSIRKEPEIAEGWQNMFINAGSDDMEVKLSAFEELNQSLTRFRGEAKLEQKENRIDDMFYTDAQSVQLGNTIENLQKSSGQNIDEVPSSQIVSNTSDVKPLTESVVGGNVPELQPTSVEFGAASKIVTEPIGIKKAFPNNPKLANEAETFVRKAYTHFHTKGKTLKGYGRFVDPDGNLWLMKKKQGAGKAARFSLVPLDKKKSYALTRYGRKAPDIEAIRQALKKHNAEHLLEALLILRRKELKLREAAIKKTGQSIGHLKSLAQKGIDVAENIADEAGKLNYARKHLNDLSDIELRKLNIPITWEDYVNLKLPLLLNK